MDSESNLSSLEEKEISHQILFHFSLIPGFLVLMYYLIKIDLFMQLGQIIIVITIGSFLFLLIGLFLHIKELMNKIKEIQLSENKQKEIKVLDEWYRNS